MRFDIVDRMPQDALVAAFLGGMPGAPLPGVASRGDAPAAVFLPASLLAGAPVGRRPSGPLLLHCEVADVRQAVEWACAQGAQVLRAPESTAWAAESALIAWPDEIVVDLYRWAEPCVQPDLVAGT